MEDRKLSYKTSPSKKDKKDKKTKKDIHKRDVTIEEHEFSNLTAYIERENEQYRIYDRTYQQLELIGKGSFGKVTLCEKYFIKGVDQTELSDEKILNKDPSSAVLESGGLCVLKIIKKQSTTQKLDVLTEIFLQARLTHPNIVKCRGWFENKRSFVLELDYIRGQDLFDQSRKRDISWSDAIDYVRQLIDIMCYLKVNNVVHRDIKPENIMVDENNRIHLCDFGLADIMKSKKIVQKNTRVVGTLDYMTPEALKRGEYGYSTDVWAMGVLLYELTYGYHPFNINNDEKVTSDNICQIKIDYAIDESRRDAAYVSLIDLLQKIFTTVEKRITIEECTGHELFINK